jgi:hypothetical protein
VTAKTVAPNFLRRQLATAHFQGSTNHRSGRTDADGKWLYGQQFQFGSDSSEIGWITRDDGLAEPLRTNDNVRINNIGRRRSRQ